MVQRHPNDSTPTVDLPDGFADPSSPTFVPVELRQAYSEIDADAENAMKKSLYTEIPAMRRTVGRQSTVLDHRAVAADFPVALHWLKLAEAGRRFAHENERRANEDRSDRDHTCRLCGRVDATANNSGLVVAGIPAIWCKACRAEWDRQQLAEHAGFKVGDSTVADLVAAARKAATP